MALINLKTDLKSLRFGKDRPGGGSSNQPYVQTPIPEDRMTNSQDFILRGGIRTARTVLDDLTRFRKYFTDLDNLSGTLFTVKQDLLTNMQVKYPDDIKPGRSFNPLSILAQIGVTQEGIHFTRQGDTLVLSDQDKYLKRVKEFYNDDTTNRLILLKKVQLNRQQVTDPGFGLGSDPLTLFSYEGGPNSSSELSRTIIKRIDNTLESEYYGQSTLLFNELERITPVKDTPNTVIFQDFRQTVKSRVPSTPSTDYTKFNQGKYGVGNPGQKGINRSKPTLSLDRQLGTVDLINLTPLYRSSDKETALQTPQDLIKFKITVLSNSNSSKDVNIHFRAYIENINDNITSEWETFQYSGRGEKFAKYKGFSRDLGYNLKIYAHTRQELLVLYRKLNFLISSLAPDYTNGFMRGNFIRLTIGDYISNTIGYLSGFNIVMPDTSPWEIGRDEVGELTKIGDQLPHYLEVTGFKFTPIHNFLPQLASVEEPLRTRFISLGENGEGYVKETPIFTPPVEGRVNQ